MRSVFILLITSLLWSCGLFKQSSTSTTKSDVKTEVEQAVDKSENKTVNTIKNTDIDINTATYATKEQIDRMIAEWSVDYTVYDTSKPIDSITGKPPVLSERNIKYKSDNQAVNSSINTTNATDKSKENTNTAISKQSNTKSHTNIKQVAKTDNRNTEGSSVPWWRWLLGGVGLSAVAIVAWKIRNLFV